MLSITFLSVTVKLISHNYHPVLLEAIRLSLQPTFTFSEYVVVILILMSEVLNELVLLLFRLLIVKKDWCLYLFLGNLSSDASSLWTLYRQRCSIILFRYLPWKCTLAHWSRLLVTLRRFYIWKMRILFCQYGGMLLVHIQSYCLFHSWGRGAYISAIPCTHEGRPGIERNFQGWSTVLIFFV